MQTSADDEFYYIGESIDEDQSISINGLPFDVSEDSFDDAVQASLQEIEVHNPNKLDITEINGSQAEVYKSNIDDDYVINAYIHYRDTNYMISISDTSEFDKEDMLEVVNSFVVTEPQLVKLEYELKEISTANFTLSIPSQAIGTNCERGRCNFRCGIH